MIYSLTTTRPFRDWKERPEFCGHFGPAFGETWESFILSEAKFSFVPLFTLRTKLTFCVERRGVSRFVSAEEILSLNGICNLTFSFHLAMTFNRQGDWQPWLRTKKPKLNVGDEIWMTNSWFPREPGAPRRAGVGILTVYYRISGQEMIWVPRQLNLGKQYVAYCQRSFKKGCYYLARVYCIHNAV